MKLKYENGRFVAEPQTAAENEVLKMLAEDQPRVVDYAVLGEAAQEPAASQPAEARPWELAVADSLGAQLDGMACDSVDRVLRELQRMNDEGKGDLGWFGTPVRPAPGMPQEAYTKGGI